jgi:hypothetical protein
MMNRNTHRFVKYGLSIVSVALVGVAMTGCSGEEEAPVAIAPPRPPAPAPPPPPRVTPIAELMAALNIDPRVNLPEDKAPDNDLDRKAVLVFFDAFARGDSKAVKTMLPLTDQLELAALVDSGAWNETVSKIQAVDIQTGSNSLGQKCALAVIEVGDGAVTGFQPQLWYFTAEAQSSLFEAAPTPPGIIDRLTGDWIAAWHQILADELALAELPEDVYEPPKKNLDTGDQPTAAAADSPGRGLKPFTPGSIPAPENPAPGGR